MYVKVEKVTEGVACGGCVRGIQADTPGVWDKNKGVWYHPQCWLDMATHEAEGDFMSKARARELSPEQKRIRRRIISHWAVIKSRIQAQKDKHPQGEYEKEMVRLRLVRFRWQQLILREQIARVGGPPPSWDGELTTAGEVLGEELQLGGRAET